jgi:hypothetical protein
VNHYIGPYSGTCHRRWFLRAICGLPLAPLTGCGNANPCPLCGGRLSTVGSHIDFRFLPSVNLAVWDRSSDHLGCTGYEPWAESGSKIPDPPGTVTCGPEFIGRSPFCTRCFHAYSERDQQWKRTTNSADSFVLPLSPEIQHFPLQAKASCCTAAFIYSFLAAGLEQRLTPTRSFFGTKHQRRRIRKPTLGIMCSDML